MPKNKYKKLMSDVLCPHCESKEVVYYISLDMFTCFNCGTSWKEGDVKKQRNVKRNGGKS